ncbi:MAG: Gfo/Idh/MocA family oxidoreductase, partial [bacterium]|nr:Gfo/Idh/MocA family oxidoreductase [bacterium]
MGKSNTRRYTAAVIGCGAIGMLGERDMKQIKPATHAGAYAVHKRITLVALVDVDSKNKKNAAQLFPGVQFFSNPEIMLKKMRPDIVSVATHTDTHVPLTELCMRSGVRAIMCEKPLAEKSKEGVALLRLQKKYPQSLVFVNHIRRFDPLLKDAAQKVREGFIGEVLQATAYYTKGIRNNGTHAIDLLRYFCG